MEMSYVSGAKVGFNDGSEEGAGSHEPALSDSFGRVEEFRLGFQKRILQI